MLSGIDVDFLLDLRVTEQITWKTTRFCYSRGVFPFLSDSIFRQLFVYFYGALLNTGNVDKLQRFRTNLIVLLLV